MSLIGISGRVLARDTVQLKSSDTNYLSVGIGLTGYNFGDDKLYRAVVTGNIIVGCLTGICWNAGEDLPKNHIGTQQRLTANRALTQFSPCLMVSASSSRIASIKR